MKENTLLCSTNTTDPLHVMSIMGKLIKTCCIFSLRSHEYEKLTCVLGLFILKCVTEFSLQDIFIRHTCMLVISLNMMDDNERTVHVTQIYHYTDDVSADASIDREVYNFRKTRQRHSHATRIQLAANDRNAARHVSTWSNIVITIVTCLVLLSL